MSAAPSPLSEELAGFIESAIASVWALETLLLLRRVGEAWSAERIVGELRASTTLVNTCLEQLQRAGLAAGDEAGWRYAPASPTLGALCDELEATYRERPVAVVNTITARRADPLKGFADSFRWRGWK